MNNVEVKLPTLINSRNFVKISGKGLTCNGNDWVMCKLSKLLLDTMIVYTIEFNFSNRLFPNDCLYAGLMESKRL